MSNKVNSVWSFSSAEKKMYDRYVCPVGTIQNVAYLDFDIGMR